MGELIRALPRVGQPEKNLNMDRLVSRTFCSLVAVLVLATVSSQAQAALVTIDCGSTCYSSRPQNNYVLGAAGISYTNGSYASRSYAQINGTLRILEDNVRLTFYDVGSESGWTDTLQVYIGGVGGGFTDEDDFGSAGGVHTPFQNAGSVIADHGVADIEFWRSTPLPAVLLVANGNSPHDVPGSSNGFARIAFAYLSGNQIVNYATDRILVLLDDGYSKNPDKDFDDYVGIIEVTAVPLPAAAWLMLSGLVGLVGLGRRRGQILANTWSIVENPVLGDRVNGQTAKE